MNKEMNEIQIDETSLEVNPDGTLAVTEEKKKTKPVSVGESAVAVGVIGAAGGAATGAFSASMVAAYVDPFEWGMEEEIVEDILPEETYDPVQVPFSNAVDDNMSFSQAFASARQEVGAGGVFYWRGGWYGTYYANEWESISDEYKEAFSNHSYQLPEEYDGNQMSTPDASLAEADYAPSAATETESGAYYDDPADSSVEILGIEYAEVDGQTMAFAPVTIDGQDSVFVDLDVDGVFDVAIVDNGTNEPDYYDISNSNITHEDMSEMQKSQDDYLAVNDLPDYTNDANVDDFIL